MNDITEELLRVKLNPPPLKRQYGKQNLLYYLNTNNENNENNSYNQLHEVVLEENLYRSLVNEKENEY